MRPHLHRRVLAAAALSLACTWATAAPLDDLRRQVEASQFEQAYATVMAHPQLMGDVHGDFLFGVAAINTGRVAEGLLALERHLAAVPANDRARLELARGYFLLGEYTRARSEFEFVLRYNPPAGVRANIAGFLQAMQVRERADNRASARFYAEAGIGHDSNVNGGTYQNDLQLSFGPFNLDGTASKQVADSSLLLAVGGQQLLRVTPRFSVFAGADIDQRQNFDEKLYNLSNVGAYAGFTQLGNNALWRLTLGASELLVGGDRYRDTLSLSGEGLFSAGPDASLMGFVQYGETRHSSADTVRNGAATTVGATYTRNFGDTAWAPSLGLRVSYTHESNLRQRKDLGRNMPLLRVFGSASPADRWRIALGLTLFTQQYGGEDILGGFNTVRHDRAAALDATVNFTITPQWSLRGEALYATQRSNQDLYDTNRRAASLKLRYQY